MTLRVAPLIALLLVALAGCGNPPAATPTTAGTSPSPAPPAPSTESSGTLAAVPDLVERASPSVVTIFTDGGLGSGVVYRADGVLVTNEHVVRGATQVEVGFADGTRVPGTVRATDRTTDLAVVQVARNGLPVPRYADQLPRPGELAVAIGSPLGLENTVSAGVVSGVGREVPGASTRGAQQLVDLIQTDTAISPGNSGGALLDATGSVIGINEAYLPPASGAVSIGFAIPSTRVVDVVDQLLVDGTADHPYLGVAVQPLTGALRDLLGVAAQRGAVVLDVAPAGPAAGAGIRPGDVITRVGSSEIATVGELLGALRGTRPGQQVPVVVQRGPQSTTLTVTIGQAPG
ncbi:S1C family serine protease [Actinomycetospora chibensis]|uniref:S1C family serine protease n=1 Tax=Actinomycetospora chibensis TaxID=663606 RepID=A0ABV9RRR5_9PSEU|nr:trypsin-like peptidase domain-containing protein [Actinomycetospora chibensis]MDD7923270.1 trypsin-like peptidase domain-containing protein [Actinomycetospora chibensis]